jgi:hypothetical protein
VAHQKSAVRVVEVVELEEEKALAETIFFSEKAQRLHDLFPNPSAAEGQKDRRSAVVEDMLRMAETLFPDVLLLRTKALEFVAKAFEAGDLAYGVADAISWAMKEG